jgi:hypothetical protein
MIHTRHIAPFVSFVLFVSFVVNLHAAPVPTSWDVNAAGTPEPSAAIVTVFQGETLTLSPRFVVGKTPLSLATNSTVTFLWQTNGMGTSYWAKAGALGALTGQVTAVWAPTNDVGARAYNFFFRVADTSGTTYRAFGKLLMFASPGFQPATLPLPTSWGDSLTSLSNALWQVVQVVSNASAAAVAAEAAQRAAGDTGLTQHVAAALGASGTVWRAEWEGIRDELYDWELGDLVGVAVPLYVNYSTIYGDILIMGRSWLQPQGGPGRWVYEWTSTNGDQFVAARIPTNVLRGSATKDLVEVNSSEGGTVLLATSDGMDDAIDEHDADANAHADIRSLGIYGSNRAEAAWTLANGLTNMPTWDLGSNVPIRVFSSNFVLWVEELVP